MESLAIPQSESGLTVPTQLGWRVSVATGTEASVDLKQAAANTYLLRQGPASATPAVVKRLLEDALDLYDDLYLEPILVSRLAAKDAVEVDLDDL